MEFPTAALTGRNYVWPPRKFLQLNLYQLYKKGEPMKHKSLLKIVLTVVLATVLSGCGRIASDSNFTLAEDATIPGPLFILSQNAILEENSSVNGPVIMLCCNLTVKGEVNGDVFLLTGNLDVKSSANIKGEVSILSGNVSK